MCFPYNSSTRRSELKAADLYDIWRPYDEEFLNVKSGRFEEILNHVIDHIASVSYMNITGGEPILLPRMWQFIDAIPDEHAKHISLSFDTNFTHTSFKGRSILEIIERFQKVHFGVSCDHYGDRLKWIRYPIDVPSFEENLRKFSNVVGAINCTVSLLNVDDLFEIRDYYKDNFGIPVSFRNVVRHPEMLSCRNLPEQDKKRLIEKYGNVRGFEMTISELEQDRSEADYQAGIKYCEELSSHRNVDFIGVFAS